MTYTIDGVQLTQEQIDKIIKDNTKPVSSGGRYFFPQTGDVCWCLCPDSLGLECKAFADSSYINMGVYKNQQELEKARDRQLACVRVRKYVQENGLYFEPDWKNTQQDKFYSSYLLRGIVWGGIGYDVTKNIKFQDTLPHYRSIEDCEQVNKACEEDIKIVLGVI